MDRWIKNTNAAAIPVSYRGIKPLLQSNKSSQLRGIFPPHRK
jgi:hypothetical protein